MTPPEGGYLDVPVREFLGLLADDQPAPGGGAAAALAVALAASLCAMAARLSGRQLGDAAKLAGKAQRLADEVAPLAQADAEAYRAVIAALREPPGAGRYRRVAAALSGAADVPLSIAEAGVRTAALAARLTAYGNPNLRGDARTAALLAQAGARAACGLVQINLESVNLEGTENDARLDRVAQLLATLDAAP